LAIADHRIFWSKIDRQNAAIASTIFPVLLRKNLEIPDAVTGQLFARLLALE
jgi:hypothetical protein